MAQLLNLLAGHDLGCLLFNCLIPLSKGQLQGGGGAPAFPLGLVVLVIFLASASATSAVMPKTANVLMVVSLSGDADLWCLLPASGQPWIEIHSPTGEQPSNLGI